MIRQPGIIFYPQEEPPVYYSKQGVIVDLSRFRQYLWKTSWSDPGFSFLSPKNSVGDFDQLSNTLFQGVDSVCHQGLAGCVVGVVRSGYPVAGVRVGHGAACH
jgi:hypothetical protein